MYSLFALLSDNIRTSLCCNLVGKNVNLGTFLTIDASTPVSTGFI